MSKNSISNKSIFGIYLKKENLISSGLLATLYKGKNKAIKAVFPFVKRNKSMLDIESQVTKQFKGKRMTFDGVVSFTNNSKIIIECKVGKNNIGSTQLNNYLSFTTQFRYELCYITQDPGKTYIHNRKKIIYQE